MGLVFEAEETTLLGIADLTFPSKICPESQVHGMLLPRGIAEYFPLCSGDRTTAMDKRLDGGDTK
jgi:hypothetical protein